MLIKCANTHPTFRRHTKEKEPQIGVVTGLAYTEYGGDILPIEVNYFKGKGSLILTGHLGDVMKESASIALDYVKPMLIYSVLMPMYLPITIFTSRTRRGCP